MGRRAQVAAADVRPPDADRAQEGERIVNERRQTCRACLGIGFVRGLLGTTPCAACFGRGTVPAVFREANEEGLRA